MRTVSSRPLQQAAIRTYDSILRVDVFHLFTYLFTVARDPRKCCRVLLLGYDCGL